MRRMCSKEWEKTAPILKFKTFYLKRIKHKRKKQHSFLIQLSGVLNSILREEFKLTQPGIEPSVNFLKIKFGISSSYANKILVHIFKSRFITLFGGFKMDEEMIRNYTMGVQDDSGFIEDTIHPIVDITKIKMWTKTK